MLTHRDEGYPFNLYIPGIILISLLTAWGIVQLSPSTSMFLVVLLALFVVGFLKTEWALYLLIFSMLLSPEIVLGSLSHGTAVESSRSLVIRLDDVLVLIISLGWLAKSAIYKELGLFLKTPLNKPIVGYVTVCLFSTLLGILFDRVRDKLGLLYVVKYIEYFFIYFIVVNNLHSRNQVKRYLVAILLTCVIVCVIALLQVPEGKRVTAPFEGAVGEPNTFGGYLALIFSVVLGLCFSLRSPNKILALAAMAVMIMVAFAFTLSRSSWIALVPMWLTLLVFCKKKEALIIATVLVVITSALVLPAQVEERISYTFQKHSRDSLEIGGISFDPSTSARIKSWKNVLQDIKNHPLMGFGITGYSFVDSQYFRTLIETGFVGLLAFLGLLLAIFRQIMRNLTQVKSPLFYGLELGMLAGIVAIYTHAIGANSFIIVRIMEPFWFLLAIAVVLPEIERQEAEGNTGTELKRMFPYR
ncbi:MAG: O-antigen ligase family protein [Candidatus Schekmanbacteria bacterium]|nr:O-antigen ligase family protein [Candidatus Schekmanbacteria bacterium]